MKLIKREEIRWDIVRKNVQSPWILLGWPVTVYYSKWGVKKEAPFIKKASQVTGLGEKPSLRIRLPWVSRECDNPKLRASLTLQWMGFLWFWRAS